MAVLTVCRFVAKAVQVTLLILRAMAGDVAATGGVWLLAVGAHCHTLWRCRLVSGVVLLASLKARPLLSCTMLALTLVEPLFPPKGSGDLRIRIVCMKAVAIKSWLPQCVPARCPFLFVVAPSCSRLAFVRYACISIMVPPIGPVHCICMHIAFAPSDNQFPFNMFGS